MNSGNNDKKLLDKKLFEQGCAGHKAKVAGRKA